MVRVTPALLLLTVLAVSSGLVVHGGRDLKQNTEKAEHPQNFIGAVGVLPSTPPGAGLGGPGNGPGLGPPTAISFFCSFPGLNCVTVRPTFPGGRKP
ncbi:hypothetical protein Nepgr_012249 [Nepenthes gracilis]|uniref:Uncharacterized protein n=1 Tax=Nepenthes gracilis TaxID=150966 RepID=A0AAD3XMW1_NEPGR|nr:hypothetical protein Nepgr_012249 [Nepenthes gracilis]